MSAMLKERPRLARPIPIARPVEETDREVSRYPMDPKGIGQALESPEEALREEERPESWQEGHSEAPDAGRGERRPIEREFTHGRSRS